LDTPHDKKKIRQKYVAMEGQALRINWCGAKKDKCLRDTQHRQEICFFSILRGTPHKLVWQPTGKYLRGANQRKKNWPAECLTGRKI